MDQYQFAVSKNKIMNTDFLNLQEKRVAEKMLASRRIQNYLFFGGNGEQADRNILLFFPEKFSKDMVEKNFSKIISVIRIILPNDVQYEHRNYLSGILKLGLKREKIGDILVRENGADLIVLNEVVPFLLTNLPTLTRFQKAKIMHIPIEKVERKEKEYEEMTIIVSSMRIDSFVSELAKCSRNKALEILKQQRVFVNYEEVTKFSKKINCQDVITIRGKGKFIVEGIEHQTRAERLVVKIKKYK